jgi:hypothetical protein
MHNIEEFVDERQKSWCIHCARFLTGLRRNRDHVPSKSFLSRPYPNDLPTVTVCTECNTSFSSDEEYTVAFLSCVLSGSTEPHKQDNASVGRALNRNSALRDGIQRSRTESVSDVGQKRFQWAPDLARVRPVVVKNARGHAYYEYGEPMLQPPAKIIVFPLQGMTAKERLNFQTSQDNGLWPELGSRMMKRRLTRQNMANDWVLVQERNYRYSVEQTSSGLRVRSVISEYLATEVLWTN